jgi:diguanylate cyclase (GGDEF)-like protein
VTAPLQIACFGISPGSLLEGSAHGPFACHAAGTLDALAASDADALLVEVQQLADLLAWPALEAAALHTAVVVLATAPEPAPMQRLVQAGVQDVLPAASADGATLARVLALAIARKRLDIATRRAYATDLSTGLPNHPQLLEHMSHLLALREREPAPMALIVLRVHGLAATEAALGVEAANVLRRKAAVRLRSGLRASDVVASIGVDAFAVLLAWIDSPQDGERVAAKLAQSLARPFSVAGRQQGLGVGAGLASYPEHGKDAESLLRRALAQAASMATVGGPGAARAADRGPAAAANEG